MKILIQQISTSLFWNNGEWVADREDAEAFAHSFDAVQYCVEREMRDVYIVLSFGHSRFDVVLHPFGPMGHEPTSRELLEQSQRLKARSKAVKERSKQNLIEMRAFLAALHQTVAAMKERKKRVPFRQRPSDWR